MNPFKIFFITKKFRYYFEVKYKKREGYSCLIYDGIRDILRIKDF